jgi:hypothetical protein
MSPLTRTFALWHLCFVPAVVYLFACDLQHPELWETWYRNPYVTVPYCFCLETVLALAFAYCRLQEWRRSRRILILQEALPPRTDGHGAAEAAARQDRTPTRMGQRR